MIERSAKHYSVEPGTIYLAGGDPNFASPPHIRDACIKAIIEGYTHYAPTAGIPEFKEAIVDYYAKFGVRYDPSQIFASAGGSAALHIPLAGLLKPGDEAIVFDPSYAHYFEEPPTLGAKVVPVPLSEPGFHLDPEDLKKRVTDKSKMIIICNPSNPTGTVFTRDELKAIADVAIDNDLVVVSDEFYSEFVYDGREYTAISSLDGMKERTIVVIGATKMFAFTGWRLACTITPEEYHHVRPPRFSAARPSTFVQVAGAVGFRAMLEPLGKGVMKEWVEEYDRRRRVFCSRLDEIDGVSCHTFEGAFYAYPDVSSFGVSVQEFVERLMKEEKLNVANGERFGGVRFLGEKSLAYGHIRPALVQDVDVLEEAADRIERFTKSL